MLVARILVVHGPNLNVLGTREQQIYGQTSLAEIHQTLSQYAQKAGHSIECFQSNHEGALVDYIQQHGVQADMLIINPAAYTHTSVAMRDAILAVRLPVIEVHLSNVYQREDIAVGQVAGFGPHSYVLALAAACHLLRQQAETVAQEGGNRGARSG
jgi:3-dehydroquinate dehydratase II